MKRGAGLLTYTQSVRRFCLLFLLVILPFQFAWGAAAGYCGHEKTAGAGHFGHHGHQHKAKADTDGEAVAKKVGAIADDPDCAMCHLGCVQPPTHQTTVVVDTPAAASTTLSSQRAESGRPGRIERPKWTLAV